MLVAGKVVGALGLAALLWLWVDWREALAAVARADPALLALALAASVASVLVSAWKWQILLRRIRVELGFGLTARLYWIGCFFSNFLPTGIGGDAVRLLLTPAAGRLEEVTGTILTERLTGLLVMLLLATFGLAVQPLELAGPWLGDTLLALVVALALGVAGLLAAPSLLLRAVGRLARGLPGALGRLCARAHGLAARVAGPVRDGRAVGLALLISVPFYALNILAHYFPLQAVGAEIGLAEVALVAPVVLLVGLLPITPNGLVLAEGAFVALYAGVGVPPELALAAAVLRRLVDLANSGFGGIAWLGWRAERGPRGEPAAGQPAEAEAGWRAPVLSAAYAARRRAA